MVLILLHHKLLQMLRVLKTVMKFTNFSDGTGESLVTKVDASALNHASDSTKIARVIYSINTTDTEKIR